MLPACSGCSAGSPENDPQAMSNVPQAKAMLDKLLGRKPFAGPGAQLTPFVRKTLMAVRGLLDRERLEYRAPRTKAINGRRDGI
jgi:hypothetical protein